MTIIELEPRTAASVYRHKRQIRRMTEGIMPRNTSWAMLITCVLVVMFVAFTGWVWWSDGAVAEGYDYNTYVRVVNAENGLWVRTGPGTEYGKCCMLGEGGKMLLKDTRPGWALVATPEYPDRLIGWVCSDYLEVVR